MNTDDLLFQELRRNCIIAESWPDKHRECTEARAERVAHLLAYLKNAFDEGDILAPVEALSVAYSGGFTLPLWAHKHFAEAFDKYLEEGLKKGSAKLDGYLNLTKTQPFSRQTLLRQYMTICDDIALFNKLLKFSLPIAYRIVRHSTAKHLTVSQITDIYKDYGKPSRSLPLYFLDFKCESLEKLSMFLLESNKDLINDLMIDGLYKTYRKKVTKIKSNFVPNKYYLDESLHKIGG